MTFPPLAVAQALFIAQALEHYKAKLAEEKERFGVLGISTAAIENAYVIVEGPDADGAGGIWDDLSKQAGLQLCVEYALDDPQVVFAILSKERVLYPGQLFELWDIVNSLESDESDAEKLESLDIYDGPYKLEVPEALFEGHMKMTTISLPHGALRLVKPILQEAGFEEGCIGDGEGTMERHGTIGEEEKAKLVKAMSDKLFRFDCYDTDSVQSKITFIDEVCEELYSGEQDEDGCIL
jgi:hypothetical protein